MRGAVSRPLPPLDFVVPPGRDATAPPERRGLARDGVRLLIAGPEGVTHTTFRQLGVHLRAGDLLVVNTSATLPAALDGRWGDRPVVVHLSTPVPYVDDADRWVVELRHPDRSGPVLDAIAGDHLALAGGADLHLGAPIASAVHGGASGVRLWDARITTRDPLLEHLERFGRPVTYGHLEVATTLEEHQTVFAHHPGSAEMPSAGRPFTPRLVTELAVQGVGIAPVRLHAGVSSLEASEPPRPERFVVPDDTARRVDATRAGGGRVVAVGTTVVRALESVAAPDGSVAPGRGWTDLVLGPDRPARVVDGLVTGWHEPGASHLSLLEAVAGRELVAHAYASALAHPYLWHEFGDSCLLLPLDEAD